MSTNETAGLNISTHSLPQELLGLSQMDVYELAASQEDAERWFAALAALHKREVRALGARNFLYNQGFFSNSPCRNMPVPMLSQAAMGEDVFETQAHLQACNTRCQSRIGGLGADCSMGDCMSIAASEAR